MNSLIYPDQDSVERVYLLADAVMRAAQQQCYFSAVLATHFGGYGMLETARTQNWAGGMPKRFKRAPLFGAEKIAELITYFDEMLSFQMGPIAKETNPLTFGVKGGVRTSFDKDGKAIFTSVSAFSEDVDLLLALMFNMAFLYEVRLHHVGFQYETLEQAEQAVQDDIAGIFGASANIARYECEGATYIYVPVHTNHSGSPNGRYWRVHKFDPSQPDIRRWYHFACMNAYDQTQWIASKVGVTPTEDTSNHNPIGTIWVKDNDGTPTGLSMRESWWDATANK